MKITEIENGLKGIELLDNAKDEIQIKVEKLVVLVVQKDFPEITDINIFCPFIHECEKSPFGWCVYNASRPMYPDVCLYCDEPEDRK